MGTVEASPQRPARSSTEDQRAGAMNSASSTGPEDSDVKAAPVAVSPLLPPPQEVVAALDATRDDREVIKIALRCLVARGDILRGGDSLLVLVGVFRPRGCTACFTGTSSAYLEDQVAKKAKYQEMLCRDAADLKKTGINVTLKIVSSSSPAKDVIQQEVNSSKAAWVLLDRLFRRHSRHFEKVIPCKVAVFEDNMSVKLLKIIRTNQSRSDGEAMKVLTATVQFEPAGSAMLGAEPLRADQVFA